MTTGWFQSSIPKTELINPKKIAKVITRNATIIRFRYGDEGLVGFSLNSTDKYYTKDLFGNISGIYGADGTKYVSYEYDAWGNHTVTLDLYGIGTVNPFRYREYYYDTETGLYYLQSRYYDPETGRFINADADLSFIIGFTGNNKYTYCSNNPIVFFDHSGYREEINNSIWSFKSDLQGLLILWHYLYGKGDDFIVNDGIWGNYMKSNELLRIKVKEIITPIIDNLHFGETIIVNIVTSMVIENGEDIIGYQYLHGTNADVGGFVISGSITKRDNGDIIIDMVYIWNDMIDPNYTYASDKVKAEFAKSIPFANPTDYYLSISWHDITVIKASPSLFNCSSGWLK